ARAVDKCRAVLAGWEGEYHSNCPLDQRWLKFAEIDYDEFRSFVATGATDNEITAWIGEHAKKRPRAEIIAWNNKERDLHLSDLPLELQEYMEDYIQQFVPRNRVVHHWFDVYDLEEERLCSSVGFWLARAFQPGAVALFHCVRLFLFESNLVNSARNFQGLRDLTLKNIVQPEEVS